MSFRANSVRGLTWGQLVEAWLIMGEVYGSMWVGGVQEWVCGCWSEGKFVSWPKGRALKVTHLVCRRAGARKQVVGMQKTWLARGRQKATQQVTFSRGTRKERQGPVLRASV